MLSNKSIQILTELANQIIEIESNELINQGHNATGTLLNSLENKVTRTLDGYEVQGYVEEYGLALEKKRQPGKPPPISALIEWARTKGLASTDKKLRQIAFAIQKAILLEGIPTTGRRTPNGKGAFRFSKVGRRTGWINETLKQADKLINTKIDEITDAESEIILNNIVRLIK